MRSHNNKFIFLLGKLIVSLHLLRKLNPWHKKVVLIDKSDGLGDVLLFLPYLQGIRKHFPENRYRITVIVRSHAAEILKIQRCADKIEVIPPYKNKLQWWTYTVLLWLMNPCDIFIATWGQCDLTNPYKSKSSVAFTYPDFDDDPYLKYYMPEKLVRIDGMTIYERHQTYLKYAGITEKPQPYDYTVFVQKPPEMCPDGQYIAVCPGASRVKRQWETEKFCKLIDLLQQRFTQKIVLIGTDKEKIKCDYLCTHCKNGNSLINLAGKTDTGSLFGVINNADFIITNDTGTAHIGALLKKKSFVIAGGGEYKAFFPYPDGIEGKYVFSIFREDHHCFPCSWKMPCCNNENDTAQCIKDISVEQVYKVIIENTLSGKEKEFAQ